MRPLRRGSKWNDPERTLNNRRRHLSTKERRRGGISEEERRELSIVESDLAEVRLKETQARKDRMALCLHLLSQDYKREMDELDSK